MRSDDDRNRFGEEPEESDEARTSDGVRITGAVPAGDDPLADWTFSTPAPAAEMPHWTDEPTGQIPASLIRGNSDESSVGAPVWREDDADWWAHEEAYDPLLLGSDEEALGALSGEDVSEESRPWEFGHDELPPSSASAAPGPPSEEPPAERAPWDLTDEESFAYVPASVEPRRRGGRQSNEPAESPVEPTEERERTAAPRRSRSDDGGQGASGRDMRTAVLTGALIALLVLVTFNIGTVLAMGLVVVAVTLAAAEAFAAFRRVGYHPATLLGLAGTVALLVGSYNRGSQALGLVFALLFIFTILWYMLGVEKTDAIQGVTSTIFVFAWIGVLGSFAALLLNPTLFPHRHGLAFLLAAIVLVVAYDVAALLIGSSVGRRPLAPEVSPNKTVEGLVGATIVTLLLSVIIVPMIHPWTMSSAICLGLATVVLCPLGDLAESMIKRSLGVKDMGRLLPGHGGLLDRVDGLLFVLPATYYLAKAFNLG